MPTRLQVSLAVVKETPAMHGTGSSCILTAMGIGDRIREAREAKGWTQTELAIQLGIRPQSVQQWETDTPTRRQTIPRTRRLEKISQLLGVDSEWLLFGTGKGPRRNGEEYPAEVISRDVILRHIPIVGTTQAGPDAYWAELGYPPGYGEEYVDAPSIDPNAFALRVKGGSMGARIREGEAVVVSPNAEPMPGEEVVVKTMSGEVMVKQLAYRRSGVIALDSIGDGYQRITINEEQILWIYAVVGIVPASRIKHR